MKHVSKFSCFRHLCFGWNRFTTVIPSQKPFNAYRPNNFRRFHRNQLTLFGRPPKMSCVLAVSGVIFGTRVGVIVCDIPKWSRSTRNAFQLSNIPASNNFHLFTFSFPRKILPRNNDKHSHHQEHSDENAFCQIIWTKRAAARGKPTKIQWEMENLLKKNESKWNMKRGLSFHRESVNKRSVHRGWAKAKLS